MNVFDSFQCLEACPNGTLMELLTDIIKETGCKLVRLYRNIYLNLLEGLHTLIRQPDSFYGFLP